jgi:UDP-galactopyranose mutase
MGHLTQEWGATTMVAIETPIAHVPDQTVPYYPIPRDENHLLHQNYMNYPKKEAAYIVFAGRLGRYRYFNMDQAVGHALQVFEEIVRTGI